MFKPALILAALCAATSAAQADAFVTRTADDSFDDVAFAVESAILAKGLVIDSVSHVGDMLERTKADVGSTVTVFDKANVYLFCSATLSRKVMEVDPLNIQFCPYAITVFQSPADPGKVTIGHRTFPEGAMQEVQSLLSDIVADAIGAE